MVQTSGKDNRIHRTPIVEALRYGKGLEGCWVARMRGRELEVDPVQQPTVPIARRDAILGE